MKLFLQLPGQLVVMEVPKVESQRRFLPIDAVQLPFPPPCDAETNRIGHQSSSNVRSCEVGQAPCPPPYDPGNPSA